MHFVNHVLYSIVGYVCRDVYLSLRVHSDACKYMILNKLNQLLFNQILFVTTLSLHLLFQQ